MGSWVRCCKCAKIPSNILTWLTQYFTSLPCHIEQSCHTFRCWICELHRWFFFFSFILSNLDVVFVYIITLLKHCQWHSSQLLTVKSSSCEIWRMHCSSYRLCKRFLTQPTYNLSGAPAWISRITINVTTTSTQHCDAHQYPEYSSIRQSFNTVRCGWQCATMLINTPKYYSNICHDLRVCFAAADNFEFSTMLINSRFNTPKYYLSIRHGLRVSNPFAAADNSQPC